MALVSTNTADVLMLQYIINALAQDGNPGPVGGDRALKLFTNNLSPGKITVLADITEASGATGYSAYTLAGSSWTTSSVAGVNAATYSEQVFSFTTAVTVYGYYITTIEAIPKLLWVERFSTAPYTIPSGGGEIAINPRITMNSCA